MKKSMLMDKEADTAPAALDRRDFLTTAGKFALVTPPAMTMLLSTSLSSPAIAASGIGGGYGGSAASHEGKPPTWWNNWSGKWWGSWRNRVG
jgi:hypothetical protein